MVCTHPTIPTNTNLDPGRPRLTKVGQDRHTTVGEDLPRWAGFASVGILDQRRPTPIRVDQRRLGWAVRRRGSVKVGTSVPMGGSECSESLHQPRQAKKKKKKHSIWNDVPGVVRTPVSPLTMTTIFPIWLERSALIHRDCYNWSLYTNYPNQAILPASCVNVVCDETKSSQPISVREFSCTVKLVPIFNVRHRMN
jgi:hypothetical protein